MGVSSPGMTVHGGKSLESVQADLVRPIQQTTWRFKIFILILGGIVGWGIFAYAMQLRHGLIETHMRDQVLWGIYISNFVFFIGISHVGALMSAILRLSNAAWRKPVTRMAEAITVCSLAVGAAMPIVDLGRPDRLLEVIIHGRIESAILWDFVSIATYLTGSLLFLYLFLIPDLGLLRDQSKRFGFGRIRQFVYRKLAAGWTGSQNQKVALNKAISIMTVLILPIAISVHTVVSWIFAMTLRVGWDSTIFGPYFVAGALFSGVASVLMAMALFTHFFHLEDYIKPVHFRNLAMILLALDIVYIYFTLNEFLVAAYKMEGSEAILLPILGSGQFAAAFWAVQFLGLIIPGILIAHPRTRTTLGIAIAATLVNATMWLKRYIIVVSTLVTPQMPDTPIGAYFPSWVEWSITAAAFSGFVLLYAIFSKVFPIVSIWEVTEEEPPEGEPQIAEREALA